MAEAHRIDAPVPSVEVTDDADAQSIRSPNGEANTVNFFARAIRSIQVNDVSAQNLPQAQMVALRYQVQVKIAEQKRKRIRVIKLSRPSSRVPRPFGHDEPIRKRFAPLPEDHLKEAVWVNSLHRDDFIGVKGTNRHAFRKRIKRPNGNDTGRRTRGVGRNCFPTRPPSLVPRPKFNDMHSQHRKRVAAITAANCGDLFRWRQVNWVFMVRHFVKSPRSF